MTSCENKVGRQSLHTQAPVHYASIESFPKCFLCLAWRKPSSLFDDGWGKRWHGFVVERFRVDTLYIILHYELRRGRTRVTRLAFDTEVMFFMLGAGEARSGYDLRIVVPLLIWALLSNGSELFTNASLSEIPPNSFAGLKEPGRLTLSIDKRKYTRALYTLVDGVIPVLLTCVLSKSDSAVTGWVVGARCQQRE